MAGFSIKDRKNMSLAMQLAAKGKYGVRTNPMVGCVITKDDEIIATGYHQTYGSDHAEIDALKKIDFSAHGSTVYITLEPCSHHGKTPPCVNALIDSGVSRVVVSSKDPNPLVAGDGIQKLKSSGVKVELGLMDDQNRDLNKGFFSRHERNRPFVTAKIAMTLDGKIALKNGESKWITSESSRKDVHLIRASSDAILTGSNTVLKDNPSLTVRLDENFNNPIRVVVDSNDQVTDKSLNIFSSNAETLIIDSSSDSIKKDGKIDLKKLLRSDKLSNINNLLVESGPLLLEALMEDSLIDEFIIYIAPKLMGGDSISAFSFNSQSMVDIKNFQITEMKQIDEDIKLTGHL
ncbi:bifunctional diaminohydroxyphosphoribosylaminopyrimidine deaminase/5-amino-6-(5-phosphoribosylamino)uracil reductase RibD [Gammaproteobacteria bacterium]|nr:bifunctional diaminohydroxyphosphoribosylaminopyrimidine deaminase/5-amino-6-(5-phosphoribosylamino)uracil reductase RibD [Gammaproteobacteria bacterium]